MSESNYNFNSMDIIRFIFKNKWPIIIITAIAAITSVFVSLNIQEKYKSSVVLFPKTQVSVSNALVSSELINTDDHIMNFGDEEATEQLIQTLHSEKIRFKIFKKFDLINHYGISKDDPFPQTKLHQEYRKNVSVKRTEFQAVRVEVLDKDPQVAADIANEISRLLDITLNEMQKEVAQGILDVVQSEYDILLSEISDLEKKMDQYKNKRPDSHYISLSEQLKSENQRLSEIKSKLVEARVNANQEIPRKFTVATAYPAEKKAYPIRWIICFVSTLSAFLFAVLLMLFIDRYKDLLGFK